jgi:hypothetical protein
MSLIGVSPDQTEAWEAWESGCVALFPHISKEVLLNPFRFSYSKHWDMWNIVIEEDVDASICCRCGNLHAAHKKFHLCRYYLGITHKKMIWMRDITRLNSPRCILELIEE